MGINACTHPIERFKNLGSTGPTDESGGGLGDPHSQGIRALAKLQQYPCVTTNKSPLTCDLL